MFTANEAVKGLRQLSESGLNALEIEQYIRLQNGVKSIITPDNEICNIVEAPDAIPISDSEYASLAYPRFILNHHID
jgi:hypothetical protein